MSVPLFGLLCLCDGVSRQDLDESCCRRYLSALSSVLELVRTETPGCPFITHAGLQQTVDDVNADVQEEQDSESRETAGVGN